MAEKKREMVRTIERIYFVLKHNSRIEIYCLLNLSCVRLGKKTISVGIEPVSSFPSILGDKIMGTKLDA